jgi:hypothetical protein
MPVKMVPRLLLSLYFFIPPFQARAENADESVQILNKLSIFVGIRQRFQVFKYNWRAKLSVINKSSIWKIFEKIPTVATLSIEHGFGVLISCVDITTRPDQRPPGR